MKKMAPWLITILLSITLIVLAAFLLINQMSGPSGGEAKAAVNEGAIARHLTADEIVKVTSTIDDIKTNLSDPNYVVVMNYAFQLDNEASKEAFDKIKDFKVKPIIIKTLADTKPEDLTGAKGKDNLSSKLTNLINKTLPEGKLIQIDITYFVMTTI